MKKTEKYILTCALFFVLLGTVSWAQISGDSLLLSGEIAFWPGGVATLETPNTDARIDDTGKFSFVIKKPRRLSVVRDFGDARSCLNSSKPEALYTAMSNFNVVRDDEVVAELYLQTPRFDYQLGDAYKEFHYYSEATTISGRCIDTFDDGFSAIYIFPDLAVKQGWNELSATITETSQLSETYVFSLDDSGAAYQWELETLDSDDYVGIGVSIALADEGLRLSEVQPGFPAQLAGLQVGDIITHIDNEDARAMNVGAAIMRIRGEAGKAVVLRVDQQGEVQDFELVRQQVSVPDN